MAADPRSDDATGRTGSWTAQTSDARRRGGPCGRCARSPWPPCEGRGSARMENAGCAAPDSGAPTVPPCRFGSSSHVFVRWTWTGYSDSLSANSADPQCPHQASIYDEKGQGKEQRLCSSPYLAYIN
uniref:Uncharacterized protein n=1 Tax=Setaria viridis TaxID=4556 RepID=A0A4U6UNH3_SETVI|nr:hypothetical protein SEVIR_5G243900v2 [Setaria viridis]